MPCLSPGLPRLLRAVRASLLLALFALAPFALAAQQGDDWDDTPPAATKDAPLPGGPEPDLLPGEEGGPAPVQAPGADEPPPPGAEAERAGARMEGRDELLGAAESYAAALEEVAAAALAQTDADGEERNLLWARAEFLLEKLYALSRQTADYAALAERTKRLLAREGLDPLLAARLRGYAAESALRQGRADEAREQADRLGMIRGWMILGPFDNERGRQFATPLPPESWPLDFARTHDGLRAGLGWRFVQTVDPLGRLDLDGLLRPNDECLAYAACAVRAEAETVAALRLGSDDMAAVWLNGRRLFSFDGVRPVGLDQDAVSCRLRAGWNLFLFKVGESTGDWSLGARLTGPDGNSLAGVHYAAAAADFSAAAAAPVEQEDAGTREETREWRIRLGAVETLETRLAAHGADHYSAYMLGFIHLVRQDLSLHDRRGRDLLFQATHQAPEEGIYYLALADAARNLAGQEPDRDENLRREILERAGKIEETRLAASLGLAEYYLYDLQNLRRAGELAGAALEENPLSLRAQFVLYDVARAREWESFARVKLEAVARRHPRAPGVLIRQAADALRRGAFAEGVDRSRRLLTLDALQENAITGLAAACRQMGRNAELAGFLKDLLALRPYNEKLQTERIDALVRAGSLEEALAAAAAALAEAPESHELLSRRGEILQRLGRPGEALVAWEAALRLRPTWMELSRYVDHLRGARDPLATEVPDLRALAAEYKDYPVRASDSRLYLLSEVISRLNDDGTHSQAVHYVVRVLNREAARDLAAITLPYESGEETARLLVARVLRADGRIESARVSDYDPNDRPAAYKILRFSPVEEGDVIEVAHRIDQVRPGFFGDYFGEIFYFQRDHPTAVARYVLENPPARPVHLYAAAGAPAPVESKTAEGRTRRVWEMSRIAAVQTEPFMPSRRELSPQVQVSTFSDWDAMAKWYWHLIKDQMVSSPEIRRQVQLLTLGQPADLDRLDAIYRWVTGEVRNEAWEFGVHGYKPYKVETVFHRRFGDCKDKASLINVMAGELGLQAWPAILYALDDSGPSVGRGREDLTLPLLSHFNHAISAVEAGGRLLWLDGTAQYRTIAGLPANDAGATAVLITPEGARLVGIPPQTARDNLWQETGELTLQPDGSALFSQRVEGSGVVAVHMRAYFEEHSPDHVLRVLTSRRWGPTRVEKAEYSADAPPGEDRVAVESQIRIEKLAVPSKGGWRLRLPLEWLRGETGAGSPLPDALAAYAAGSVRVHDLLLPLAFQLERTLHLALPRGYTLSPVPPVTLDYPFGRLEATAVQEGATVTVRRLIRLDATRIPLAQYAAFRLFCHQADEIDARELILLPEGKP